MSKVSLNPWWALVLVAAAVLLGTVWFKWPAPAVTRPNVVLISIDSLRADHLGCYGYERDTSPAIDALAESGILFELAVSQAPWTLPSHASLFTSRYVKSHLLINAKRMLPPELPTIAEALRGLGYGTAAVVSGPYMRRILGLDAGFDRYDDSLAQAGRLESHQMVTSAAIHDKAVALLEELADGKPFFLFLHYWDVHYDYIPPPPYDRLFDPDYVGSIDAGNYEMSDEVHAGMDPRDLQHIVALYDGEIRYVDVHIGLLLEELRDRKLDDNTIVIFTADHGDEFYEHGEKGHSHSVYNELIQVPLIVRLPDLAEGKRVPDRVQLVDLFPTIMGLVGGEIEGLGLQGRSLLPLCFGNEWDERPVFADTTRFRRVKEADTEKAYAQCVLYGRYKLIRHRMTALPNELYDLQADPGEQHPLEDPTIEADLRARLMAWESELPRARTVLNEGIDADTLRWLRSLGYVDE
ncbi:MAG: sulfatase [Phycisphaerales bacterium]|nr:MAG: sulfatase [Phycisphaerales bacterium]